VFGTSFAYVCLDVVGERGSETSEEGGSRLHIAGNGRGQHLAHAGASTCVDLAPIESSQEIKCLKIVVECIVLGRVLPFFAFK
jgi:hypothetical protein